MRTLTSAPESMESVGGASTFLRFPKSFLVSTKYPFEDKILKFYSDMVSRLLCERVGRL